MEKLPKFLLEEQPRQSTPKTEPKSQSKPTKSGIWAEAVRPRNPAEIEFGTNDGEDDARTNKV
jgi:hypothetical protein